LYMVVCESVTQRVVVEHLAAVILDLMIRLRCALRCKPAWTDE
jgi:hypothetical protein